MDAARRLCRNPRCRLKLKQPEANPRSAFCSRGCHASFYRKRCMACEQPMERKVEHQLLCGRRKCRTEFAALRRHDMLGCYHIPEMSIKPGIEGASETHPTDLHQPSQNINKIGHQKCPRTGPTMASGGWAETDGGWAASGHGRCASDQIERRGQSSQSTIPLGGCGMSAKHQPKFRRFVIEVVKVLDH